MTASIRIRSWEHAITTSTGGSSADGSDQTDFGVVGGHVTDVLEVWPNEVVQRIQFEGGGGYKVIVLRLNLSLGLFGLVGRRQVLLPRPGSATGHLIAPGDHHTLHHIQVHFGVDFQADFEDVALTWNHTKDHNRRRKLCFHHLGHIPIIRGNPDLHFECAGNGPVVITWICREHGCTAAHLRSRSLNIVSLSYRSWYLYTTGQLVDGLQQKKENQFSLTGNGIMSSFLGRQFYRSTLYILMCVCAHARVCVVKL